MCYRKSDDHAGLWDTLSAWADAVRNPEEWTGKVSGLAQKRPIEVTPHERGQVVELVSSKHGAKRFADARPAPSAEWMCVFDPNVRYGEPRKRSRTEERRVGKERASTCRSRWSQYHKKKNQQNYRKTIREQKTIKKAE